MKKKGIGILFIFLFLFLFYKGYQFSIKEHTVTYQIHQYHVREHFVKENSHLYEMTIQKGKNTYLYTLEKNLKKQKYILKDIKTYKSGDVVCILPIYKKEIENSFYCNWKREPVSVDYLLKSENSDFQVIQEKLKKQAITYPSSSDVKTEYEGLTVYNQNILEEDIYYIWNYKGIYILEKVGNTYQKILDYDLYDTILSCVVNQKFVLLENTSVNGIQNVYVYDPIKRKLNSFLLKEVIAKDSYINGVVDGLVYLTDRKNKKEYTLDIQKGMLTAIDDEQTEYLVYRNGQKETLTKSDFFLKDQYFDVLEYDEDFEREGIYNKNSFYYQEENQIYKVYSFLKEKPILLLELENIKEWTVIDGQILLLQEDTLYSYTEEEGLRKIVEYNELKYNYKNIYKIGKK